MNSELLDKLIQIFLPTNNYTYSYIADTTSIIGIE